MSLGEVQCNKEFQETFNKMFPNSLKIKLPIPLSEPPYAKKDSWIIWLVNEKHQITDLEVYETFPDEPRRVFDYLKYKLEGTPYRDVGNSMADWNQWTLQDIFHMFGFQHEFETHELKIKSLKKFGKIKEWAKTIEDYLEYYQ